MKQAIIPMRIYHAKETLPGGKVYQQAGCYQNITLKL